MTATHLTVMDVVLLVLLSLATFVMVEHQIDQTSVRKYAMMDLIIIILNVIILLEFKAMDVLINVKLKEDFFVIEVCLVLKILVGAFVEME